MCAFFHEALNAAYVIHDSVGKGTKVRWFPQKMYPREHIYENSSDCYRRKRERFSDRARQLERVILKKFPITGQD